MKKEELDKHYLVYKNKDKSYSLCTLEERGRRSKHKYLCSLKKERDTWMLPNSTKVDNIACLKKEVENYVKSLEYDSEYYDPMYREGYFEDMIIHDYLVEELNFKCKSNSYHSNDENIYGMKSQISLMFYGLDVYGGIEEKVEMKLFDNSKGFTKWLSVTTNRNVKDIKSGIDSLLKPLYLADAAAAIIKANKFINDEQLDIMFNDSRANKISIKNELKIKLQELINKL